jgi:hypothetical protein
LVIAGLLLLFPPAIGGYVDYLILVKNLKLSTPFGQAVSPYHRYEVLARKFSINIPLNELPEKYKELPENKLIVTACPTRIGLLLP